MTYNCHLFIAYFSQCHAGSNYRRRKRDVQSDSSATAALEKLSVTGEIRVRPQAEKNKLAEPSKALLGDARATDVCVSVTAFSLAMTLFVCVAALSFIMAAWSCIRRGRRENKQEEDDRKQ
ncbi:PREDICTED: uncharacterized protein LOC106818547 [Priapulus caudatus]|uniref:Uncharacterized protein LOC106818547 n=1 Tax=Priapulus caudatus TaxID=37621 RepID=A0ABM1F2R2_PRICU|nr:PREDICTED: uncharacterized protein LOC106818547 [Priapulus caudatus]